MSAPLPPFRFRSLLRFELGAAVANLGIPESGRWIERSRIGPVFAHDTP